MKNRWYKEAVFYQIYPRSFYDSDGNGIGDIRGVIEKIDYIKSLGIDAIWFSPLYASPNFDYGYDIADYKAINPEYGTMADFDEMISKLHEVGIKVVMDLVINHTSSKHKWFVEAEKDKNSPYRNYYYWADGKGKNGKKPPNNWTSFFTGPAWTYSQKAGQWYLHLFDENQPDLNYFNPKVVEEIQDVLRFWCAKGVDGYRCDVINLLSKTAGLPDGKKRIALTGKEHYLDGDRMEELLSKLQEVLRAYDSYTVGESVMIDVDKALRYTTEGNEYLTTIFSFDHVSADNFFGVKQLVRKFSLRRLKRSVETWQHGLYGKSWNTLFWENHDQARIVGRYCDAGKYRVQGAKMMANVLMTLSGTPFVYQGQELGMTSARMQNIFDYRDVDTQRSYTLLKQLFGEKIAMKNMSYCSRDNARTPMQWNDTENAGFTSSYTPWLKVNPNYTEINAESQENNQNSVLNYYRRLIALRKENKAFVYGTYTDLMPRSTSIWAYLRQSEYGDVIVVSNFSAKQQKVKLPYGACDKDKYMLSISNYDDSTNSIDKLTVLRPHESIVFVKK